MYLLYLEVPQSDIGKLLSDLAPYIPNMKDFRMEVGKEPAPTAPKRKRLNRRSGRSRVQEVILNKLSDGQVHSYFDLQLALTEAGFSDNSLSPALSYLKRDGKVHIPKQNHAALAS